MKPTFFPTPLARLSKLIDEWARGRRALERA
jgi:hypothetical protein